ncbi:MAG: S1 family peptidase [Elusimicrobia bacterium]|nr:S1 family peptidase [Elusimicrobiota bacterium]
MSKAPVILSLCVCVSAPGLRPSARAGELATGPSWEFESSAIEPAIVGNPREVNPGEYEGVVLLQFRNYTEDGRSKLCTGTLISSRTVLTAGHCIWNLKSAYSKKDYSKHPEEITTWAGVAIGNPDPNDPRSGRIISGGAVAAAWHPQWQGGEGRDAVDMGLVFLAPGQAEGIKPYAAARADPEAGKKGVIVGYGTTRKGKSIVKHMGITGVRKVTERIISIGGESSICSGDSGGPLFGADLNVAGVASITTFDCNPGAGAMARVDTRISWIDSVSGEWEGASGVRASSSRFDAEIKRLGAILEESGRLPELGAPLSPP